MPIDWSHVDTVLLDMDGTLLDLHYDNYFWLQHLPQKYAELNHISEQDALAVMYPLLEDHKGTLNWYCVDFWSDTLQINIMQHKAEITHKIAYRPGAQDFLTYCQQHSSNVRLITNGHRKVLDLKIQKTNIDQYFDDMVCSHELHAPKEQQGFWYNLQKQKAFDPEKTLFIDDSEAVLDSAHRYGIKHIFSIEQPDSNKQREVPSKYSMLRNFEQLFV